MGAGRPPGHKKSGGRQKGVLNKSSLPIEELCALHNCNPVEVMIEFAKGDDKGFKFQAAKELMNYILPKKRALEIDANVNIELAKKAEEYAKLPKEEQIQLMEEEIKRLRAE